MKKKIVPLIIIFMIIFFISFASFAEKTIDQKIADLEKKVQTVPEKEKVRFLNELAYECQGQYPERCLKYAKQALELSRKIKDPVGEASALRYIGERYRIMGDNEKALEYGKKSLEICKKSGDKKGLAGTLNDIGIIYAVSSNYDKAIENFRESLKIREEVGHKSGIAESLQNIGNIYLSMGNYKQALEFYLEALERREELGDERNSSFILSNIGVIYRNLGKSGKALEFFRKALKKHKKIGSKRGIATALTNIGDIYKGQKNYQKALESFLDALKIQEEIGDKRNLATSLHKIGEVYEKSGNNHRALAYFRESLKTREEIGDKSGIAHSLVSSGWIYTKLEKYDEAFLCLTKGLNLSKEIKAKDKIKHSYENFSAYYEAKGDYKKALEYHKLYSGIKDTILNEESNRQIAEMQTRYNTLKKEKEIETLTKNNEIQKLRISRQEFTRNAFIIGFGLVLIILIVLFKKYLYLFSFWKKQKYIGQFRLVEEIGSGGMGVIYKAHNIRDKTDTAAVKVLKQELFKDETGRKRFMQEAAIIDKLDHPNIIKILQRGQYKDKLFIAMELLQGKTLDAKIDEEGKLALKECFHIMMQVADSLVLIHGKNIIHRDLKPSNIMLIERNGDPNFVKLLDFGLARMKAQTRLTRTGVLVGTLNYMSPEQLAHSEYSSASDVYALGVTFYEMITGKIAFHGDTANEIMKQILDTTPIEPNRFRPDIPGELNDLIMKMLEKKKEARPVIKDVFENLQKIHAGFN